LTFRPIIPLRLSLFWGNNERTNQAVERPAGHGGVFELCPAHSNHPGRPAHEAGAAGASPSPTVIKAVVVCYLHMVLRTGLYRVSQFAAGMGLLATTLPVRTSTPRLHGCHRARIRGGTHCSGRAY